ncbi:MAG: rhamnose ABC transporter substrate-binding protein, partial [Actinomycetota bacterium]|nr:rhamnose ABC transporter substrate-binding protein [Actinomycetota bacterium]
MTFQNRRFTALAALSLVAGLGLTACGSDGDGESASGDGDLSITMLPKNLGNPYFDTSTGGAEDAAAELGASVEEV